jgi:SPP1 family predicted phage head-tail adaptor
MRHKIEIEAEGPSTDAGGGQIDPWLSPTLIATLRASVVPRSGSERIRAMQTEDKITHKITARYKAGITAKHRAKFRGRYFNIRAVINIEEADRFLEILAEEGVGGAID